MFEEKKIKELVLSTLIADSYCLGAHWVYDEKQLKSSSINWENLNSPLSIWHKDKVIGDFTHYGDQSFWLYDFLKDKEDFDINEFSNHWLDKMNRYNGYIDSATRKTLENIENAVSPSGSDSTDLSIVGRIVPLLKVSKDKDTFLKNVDKLVKMTHNSRESLNASIFFARLLWRMSEKSDIEKEIIDLKEEFDSSIQSYIQKGIDSKNEDTFKTIREFGPACDVSEGFAGIIHLLCKYKDIKEMLIENSKAGGDSSARGMIATAIMSVNSSLNTIPRNWFAIKAEIEF